MIQQTSRLKHFLIHKGERLGMALAGTGALLMLASGARIGLSVDRPSATAAEIKARAAELVARLETDPPSPETAASIDPRIIAGEPSGPVRPERYAHGTEYFGPAAIEATYRLNPAVLGPVEFQTDVLRPLVRCQAAANLVPGGKQAETVEPCRMVVVSAAFPYTKQLEAYRSALRLQAIEELAVQPEQLPRFLPLHIRRRTLDADDKVREDWADLDVMAYGLLLERAAALEPDPATYKPLLFDGLIMRRPELAYGNYPPVRLEAIGRTLRLLEEKRAFDPVAGQPARQGALRAPEFCLVRFCDVTVQPGLTYQYQVQMHLANPNFGKHDLVAYPSLAATRELVGDWAPREPVSVSVSGETFSYATGLKADRDTALVQVQRWHKTVRLDPARPNTQMPIGLWCVADVPVRRGEYIGGYPRIDLPMWFPAREAFGFAPSQNPAKKGVPVDFRTGDILVDFEGGRLATDKDSADMELLVLGADGKLRVRRASSAAKDAERQRRAAEWRKLSETIRTGAKGGG